MSPDVLPSIRQCCVAVGIAIVVIPACSYTTNVRYDELNRVSAPLVINGVQIVPSFFGSPQGPGEFRLNRGAPWYLVVTSEAPGDASSLLVSEAIAKGDGWEKSLLPEGKTKTGTYQKTADGLTWLQFSFRDVGLDKPIPKDAAFQLLIRGAAKMKDHEFPFEGKFTFKSVISVKTVQYNPLVDR